MYSNLRILGSSLLRALYKIPMVLFNLLVRYDYSMLSVHQESLQEILCVVCLIIIPFIVTLTLSTSYTLFLVVKTMRFVLVTFNNNLFDMNH